MVVDGSYAYVAEITAYGGWGGGLRVIDVGAPASPVEVGAYDTPGDTHGVGVSDALTQRTATRCYSAYIRVTAQAAGGHCRRPASGLFIAPPPWP